MMPAGDSESVEEAMRQWIRPARNVIGGLSRLHVIHSATPTTFTTVPIQAKEEDGGVRRT